MDKVILTVGLLIITIIGTVMTIASLATYIYVMGIISTM